MRLIADIVEIYANYSFETAVLVASVRHPQHVVQAAAIGADVVTLPFKVLEQLYRHPLTDLGLERFLADWQQTGRGFDEI
jgi:transaldolase